MTNPVYTHEKDPKLTSTAYFNKIDDKYVKKRIQKANTPFVGILADRIIKAAELKQK